MRLAIAVLLLAACGATSYEDSIDASRQIGPDRFFVQVSGNARTSKGQAMEYLHRRAQELCAWAGFNSYVFEDRAEDEQTGTVRTSATTTADYSKPEMSAIVRCTYPRQPPAAAPPARGGPGSQIGL